MLLNFERFNGQIDAQVQTPYPTIERNDTIVDISTEIGDYRIIYEEHNIGFDKKKLGVGYSGIVLESGQINYKWMLLGITIDHFNESYELLFEDAKKNGIPVYYVDAKLNECSLKGELTLLALESAIGASFLYGGIGSKNINRRDFLKYLFGASYLLIPAFATASRILSVYTDLMGEETGAFNKFSEKVHPEIMILTKRARNTITAYKEQRLMEQLIMEPKQSGELSSVPKIVERPRLVTIAGGMHDGLEDEILSSPQKKLKFLKSIDLLLRESFEPETIYRSVRFNYNGVYKQWEVTKIYEFPELKKLVL